MALWLVLAFVFSPTGTVEARALTPPSAARSPDNGSSATGSSATSGQLSEAFERALHQYAAGLGEKTDLAAMTLTFDQPTLSVATDAQGAPAIRTTSFNPSTGRFVFRVVAPDGVSLVALSGHAREALRVPVPTRALSRGEPISADDLDWTHAPAGESTQFATTPDDLVGMAPKRTLPVGSPVRLSDLAAPMLVERGDIVTMVVNAPGLRLTHKGVARKAGAARDIIDVENIRSGRTIRAVVIRPGIVEAAGPTDAPTRQRSRS